MQGSTTRPARSISRLGSLMRRRGKGSRSQDLRPIAVHVPYACRPETVTDGSPLMSLLLLCKAGEAGDEKRAQRPAKQLLDVEVVGDHARRHELVLLLELYDWQELIQAIDKSRRQTRG